MKKSKKIKCLCAREVEGFAPSYNLKGGAPAPSYNLKGGCSSTLSTPPWPPLVLLGISSCYFTVELSLDMLSW